VCAHYCGLLWSRVATVDLAGFVCPVGWSPGIFLVRCNCRLFRRPSVVLSLVPVVPFYCLVCGLACRGGFELSAWLGDKFAAAFAGVVWSSREWLKICACRTATSVEACLFVCSSLVWLGICACRTAVVGSSWDSGEESELSGFFVDRFEPRVFLLFFCSV